MRFDQNHSLEDSIMQNLYLGHERNPSPRVQYALDLLKQALQDAGYNVVMVDEPWSWDNYRLTEGRKLFVANRTESEFLKKLEELDVLLYHCQEPVGEGFYLVTLPGDLTVVSGGNDTGVLYGCQELARRIRKTGKLPENLAFGDAPQFSLRGPAIGLQLTYIEPPRQTYEYPVTPNRFPWFYDRELWRKFLDMMLEERCNVVYIWSGHPFSSFVKLPDYPEALEVTEEEYQLNRELLTWLTQEADKRGIWVVLKFYNIHIPLPFAEKHGLSLKQPKPLPITQDYYIKSIAEFIRSFPNIGLMVCLGEALNGHTYGVEWFNETILKGVEKGLADLNLKEKPPIILRAHAIQPEKVMPEVVDKYPNLYTMAKYNGESLTTYTPRGDWQKRHQFLGSLDSIHIINVHILANLEPFRYGSAEFIQKSMQACKYRLHANGLHLYPLFFWDWPYAPDKAEKRLLAIERDWIWYKAWFRYAWNPDRDPELERVYWAQVLGERFGSEEAGDAIREAYDQAGECAPKLLRRFGITEGNRQTMSLGMLMSQLTNPDRHSPWPDLWESQSPAGERLPEFVEREVKGEPHVGETPLDIIRDVERHADAALEAIRRAEPLVTRNREEFDRIKTDMEAIRLMSYVYTTKVRAAIRILTYKHKAKGNYMNPEYLPLLQEAAEWMEKSLDYYRELTALTERTYLYANSMQTPQRRIPIRDGGKYKHWTDCLPVYEQELANFKSHVHNMLAGVTPKALEVREETFEPYPQVPFKLLSDNAETYTVQKNSRIFTDGDIKITHIADELVGLTGVRFSQQESVEKGVALTFEFERPARVLVGYFNTKEEGWLQPPSLEEDTHAEEHGGVDPILRKGLKVYVYPSINVHGFRFPSGKHTLELGKGAYLVLGVVENKDYKARDVEHKNNGVDTLDWLYEAEADE